MYFWFIPHCLQCKVFHIVFFAVICWCIWWLFTNVSCFSPARMCVWMIARVRVQVCESACACVRVQVRVGMRAQGQVFSCILFTSDVIKECCTCITWPVAFTLEKIKSSRVESSLSLSRCSFIVSNTTPLTPYHFQVWSCPEYQRKNCSQG